MIDDFCGRRCESFTKEIISNTNTINKLKEDLIRSRIVTENFRSELIWTQTRLQLWMKDTLEESELRKDNPMLEQLWDNYKMAIRLLKDV